MPPRISQREIKPTGVIGRNLDIIRETATISAQATLAAGEDTIFSLTTESKRGYPILIEEDISLFETSISEANLIPNGANINMADYQIIGPWREQVSGDGKNIVSKIYVRNATSGTSTTDTKDVVAAGGNPLSIADSAFRSIAETSDGALIVVYVDSPSSPVLKFKTSTDQGATWSAATTVFTITGMSSTRLNYDIFVDSSDNVYVVSQDSDGSGHTRISMVKLTHTGAGAYTVEARVTIVLTTQELNSVYGPSVVKQSGGRIFVGYSWLDGSGTNDTFRVVYSDDDGASWSSPSTLSTNNTNNKDGTLVLRNNNPFAIWRDRTDGKFYYSEWNGSAFPAQTLIYDPTTTNGYSHWWNAIVDLSNNVHLVNQNIKTATFTLDYSFFNGISWSAPANLASGTQDGQVVLNRDSAQQFLYWIQTNTMDNPGNLVMKNRISATWDADPTTLYSTAQLPEQASGSQGFATDTFRYVIFLKRGSALSPLDNIKIYRDIIGGAASKTVLFRGKTRYISPVDDVTIS